MLAETLVCFYQWKYKTEERVLADTGQKYILGSYLSV